MKFALIDIATGFVKQWQDEALYGYAETQAGEQRIALPDDFQFPEVAQWCVGGAFTGSDPTQTPDVLLARAQPAQIGEMVKAYAAAIAQDVSFTTAGGVTKAFQANPPSVANAQAMIAAYSASGVPPDFYWVSSDNSKVPFTLADLQGLAKAMGDQGWAAFQQLQERKASILAATTVAAVQAVTWLATVDVPVA